MELATPPTNKVARTHTKLRRFNTSVLERHATSDVADKFSLSPQGYAYKEGRQRANSLHSQASRLALINSLLTVFVIICAFIENEANYYRKLTSEQSAALRAIICACSLIQIMLTLRGAQSELELLKVTGQKHINSKS